MKHIAGTKMGLVDYFSRNPVGKADPELKYDTSFIVATINNIKRNIAKALVDQRSTICPNLKELDQKSKNSQTKGRQIKLNSKLPACMEQSECSNKQSVEQSHRSNKQQMEQSVHSFQPYMEPTHCSTNQRMEQTACSNEITKEQLSRLNT